jgi:hypothetical protein
VLTGFQNSPSSNIPKVQCVSVYLLLGAVLALGKARLDSDPCGGPLKVIVHSKKNRTPVLV